MEEAVIKRILPHSMEAEQSVIGSMIMDRDAIVVASEILSDQDFYQKQYGILFDTMIELNNEGKPVDLVTLQDKLKEKNVPPELCSIEFIRGLITAVPTSANVKHYATIVKEKAVLRNLIKVTESITNDCYLGNESVEELLEVTEKKVFDIVQNRGSTDFVSIQDVVINAIESIEAASKSKGTVTGIATGFYDLDYKMAGL